MRHVASTLLGCMLAACASAVPHVSIPIAVPCIKDKPAAPAFVTDAELLIMNDYQLGLALYRYRLQAGGYIGELEAVVDGCTRLAPPTR